MLIPRLLVLVGGLGALALISSAQPWWVLGAIAGALLVIAVLERKEHPSITET